MRWSKAAKLAVAPDPIEMMICLYAWVVQSPAAKIPGTEVRHLSLIHI